MCGEVEGTPDSGALVVPSSASIGRRTAGVHTTNSADTRGIEGVDVVLSLSLNNSDEVITLSIDDRVLDSVSYESSKPGVATQVDEAGNTCDAVNAYGDGDLGTPGVANPWCF